MLKKMRLFWEEVQKRVHLAKTTEKTYGQPPKEQVEAFAKKRGGTMVEKNSYLLVASKEDGLALTDGISYSGAASGGRPDAEVFGNGEFDERNSAFAFSSPPVYNGHGGSSET
jgi:hypothetical protein